MARCPICQNDYDPMRSGQLCPKCSAEVLAKDAYSAQDLRFVGVLAGVLFGAIFSMPGAFIGHFVGEWFQAGTRGTTIGVLISSVMGLFVGYCVGTSFVRKIESARGVRG